MKVIFFSRSVLPMPKTWATGQGILRYLFFCSIFGCLLYKTIFDPQCITSVLFFKQYNALKGQIQQILAANINPETGTIFL